MDNLIELALALAMLVALGVVARLVFEGVGAAIRGAGEGAKAAGQGAKHLGDGAGGLLGGVLAGLGAGAGGLVSGLGAGVGNVVSGAGRALRGGGSGGGGGGGKMRMFDGPMVPTMHRDSGNSKPWGHMAAGFGVGLGLGAAGLQGARSAASSAWRQWQAYQARRQWQQWHSQAPAYAWSVNDDFAAGVMSGHFAQAGVRFDWHYGPDGSRWVVIDAEDLAAAEAAMGAVGLEFQEYGQPIGGADGDQRQPETAVPDSDVIEADWRPVPVADDAGGELVIYGGGE